MHNSRVMCAARLLAAVLALALAGCAGLPARSPSATAAASQGPLPPEPSGSVSADAALEVAFHAMSLLGTPYRLGGSTPQDGFDCSGLIRYVYLTTTGKSLPRTVLQLVRIGQRIELTQARAGDLVFFDTAGAYSHAGIFVGDARFVHAPSTGGAVRIERIDSPYWKKRFTAVVRP